jgi:hypothetical protein
MKIDRSKEWWMDQIEKEGDANVGAGVSNTTAALCRSYRNAGDGA